MSEEEKINRLFSLQKKFDEDSQGIHDYDKKVVLDGMLTIVSGGLWLLLKMMKDGIMWSFNGGEDQDVAVFDSKHKCKKCGKQLEK